MWNVKRISQAFCTIPKKAYIYMKRSVNDNHSMIQAVTVVYVHCNLVISSHMKVTDLNLVGGKLW